MKLKITSLLLLLIISQTFSYAQKKKKANFPSQPKLVVGIVVDQMRYDFLYKYYNKYSEGGFKRLMNQGFNCRNNHYDYAPTVTAAGHAAVFTGSVPAIDGIIGNEWYDRRIGRTMYCVEDTTVSMAGGTSKAGKMSPKNLLVSTITDQLKLATNQQAKVIGIAQKDRGAILPAGHSANAAYWFDSKDGSWITSTFYMKETPTWVQEFNNLKLPQKYIAEGWKTLLPIDQYTESTSDNQPFENKLTGEDKPVFPHEIIGKSGTGPLEVFRVTPFGNTVTKDFAIATLQNEKMGKSITTDFLTVSFSSTDYVGHSFGPNSIETEDTYLRLDRDIEEILNYLDTNVGKDNVLVFLTADHGIADIPAYQQSLKMPAGVFDKTAAVDQVKANLKTAFGEGEYILAEDNYQLYLNHATLETKKITINQVYEVVRKTLLSRDDVADVVNLHDLGNSSLPNYQLGFVKNGYNPRRSGDIMLILNPQWFIGFKTGTTHGVSYRYDTHVPLLFYGWKVNVGESTQRTNISDISPTVADFLNILEPNGSIGNVIQGVKQ
jgi:predicted AlkP superfamily pyrophosphatase or phosphodiesterase